MLNREQIEKTERFLKQRFDGSAWLNAHPAAKAYRLGHSYRVANIGRQIAEREGFDETEMVIACLLHDVAYCEDLSEAGWQEHGRRSAQIARPFLQELGLAADRVDDICFGIAIHVDDRADFPGERTPFACTVGDADNIDRFDALRIQENFSRDGFQEMSSGEKREYAVERMARLRKLGEVPMATEAAAELWQARLSFYSAFCGRIAEQLENSGSIVSGREWKQIFESDRIRFVEISERLIPDYLVMVNDIEHVERFLGGQHEPYTEEQERRWVNTKLAERAPVFSMLEKESGDFIGNIELMDPTDAEAELGIALTAEKQDRGYGTEAVVAMTRYGLERLGLKRIFLRVDPANARAIRVYEKCGFRAYGRTETHISMEFTR